MKTDHRSNGRWYFENSYNNSGTITTYQSMWNPANPNTITMSYVRGATACTGTYLKHVEEEEEEEPPPPPPPTPVGTFKGARNPSCSGGVYDGAVMEVTLEVTTLPVGPNHSIASITFRKDGVIVHGPADIELENYTFEPNITHIADLGFTTESGANSWSFTAKYRPGMDNFLVDNNGGFTGQGGNTSNCGGMSLVRQ